MTKGPVVVVGTAAVEEVYRVNALPLPGEAVRANEVRRGLGGRGANVSAAARRLGAPVVFVTRLGDDSVGTETRAELAGIGVEIPLPATAGASTGRAVLVLDEEGEGLSVFYAAAGASLSAADVASQGDHIKEGSIVVTSLVLDSDTVTAAAEAARRGGALSLLDARLYAESASDLFPLFDHLVAGRPEVESFTGVGISGTSDALAAMRALVDLGARDPVLFLGHRGAACFDQGRAVLVPSPRCMVAEAPSAADAFVGALTALLREGEGMRAAVEGACRYAAMVAPLTGGRSVYPDRAEFDAAAG